MKKALVLFTTILAFSLFVGCFQSNDNNKIGELSEVEKTFFGDSAVVLIAQKPQNGYKVSIIYNAHLCLCHFERGDSINQYCAIPWLPSDVRSYENSVGVYSADLNFPVIQPDTLMAPDDSDMFFMDMNFDGEEEFVVACPGGNGAPYYTCYDLVHKNWDDLCPNLQKPLNEPPYDMLVSGRLEQSAYTVFDYQNREIHEFLSSGCCKYYEVWAKYFDGADFTAPIVKVVKRVECDGYVSGQLMKTYLLQDDTLKLVKVEDIPF